MKIEKAKCCGTCKFWQGDWLDDYGAYCEIIRKGSIIIHICDKHEWKEGEEWLKKSNAQTVSFAKQYLGTR